MRLRSHPGIRLVFVLLLALLLPVRGYAAAMMQCGPSQAGAHGAAQSGHPPHHAMAGDTLSATAPHDGPVHHHPSATAGHHHDAQPGQPASEPPAADPVPAHPLHAGHADFSSDFSSGVSPDSSPDSSPGSCALCCCAALIVSTGTPWTPASFAQPDLPPFISSPAPLRVPDGIERPPRPRLV